MVLRNGSQLIGGLFLPRCGIFVNEFPLAIVPSYQNNDTPAPIRFEVLYLFVTT